MREYIIILEPCRRILVQRKHIKVATRLSSDFKHEKKYIYYDSLTEVKSCFYCFLWASVF